MFGNQSYAGRLALCEEKVGALQGRVAECELQLVRTKQHYELWLKDKEDYIVQLKDRIERKIRYREQQDAQKEKHKLRTMWTASPMVPQGKTS